MKNCLIFLLAAIILSGCVPAASEETVPPTVVTRDAYEILSTISEDIKQITDPLLSDALKEIGVTDYTLTGWSMDYYDPAIQPVAAIAPVDEVGPQTLYLLSYQYQEENQYSFILQYNGLEYTVIASGPDFVSSSQAIVTPVEN